MTDTRPPALVEIRLSDTAGYSGYDPEADEPYGEITIGDLVVRSLVDKIAPKLQEEVARQVREQLDATVRARVGEWVDAALARPIQKTNSWGQPDGPATSIPELVSAQVEKWLTAPDRDSAGYNYRGNPTRLQRMIGDEVDRRLAAEMSDAIRTAKAQVVKAVQTKGGELLGEAIRTANLLDGVR